MAYEVNIRNKGKEVEWEADFFCGSDYPTLAEIIEVAQKEFSGVSFEKLLVTAAGYDAEIICLKCKN